MGGNRKDRYTRIFWSKKTSPMKGMSLKTGIGIGCKAVNAFPMTDLPKRPLRPVHRIVNPIPETT